MTEPRRDLVERSYAFAQAVRRFVNELPVTLSNREDSRQLVRSSGSVAANYLEAQEGLSRKDFFFRIKICRKEARESWLWLRLLSMASSAELEATRQHLTNETDELVRILSSIAKKSEAEGQ
jgi:four helix bundle protein